MVVMPPAVVLAPSFTSRPAPPVPRPRSGGPPRNRRIPYQRFGTVTARISEISSAVIPKATAEGVTVPVYLVTANCSQSWVPAFGRRQPLLPGMTLTARIVTKKQTLFEWLFEPLFAVSRR